MKTITGNICERSEFTDKEYKEITDIAYSICGIAFTQGKKEVVKGRLLKRMNELDINSFGDYINRFKNDRKELSILIDILTTNKTDFFREFAHFDFMRKNIYPFLNKNSLTLWSAGCSSGEEPYSIAMDLNERLKKEINKRILATDISARMLDKARDGIYDEKELEGVPGDYLKYFSLADAKNRTYRIDEGIKKYISFARLNLMDSWPMRGPFDIIFCRNVMIYFDKATQEILINRFYDLLAPGGYLFTGHSESLNSLRHRYAYIMPAVYRKENR